MGAVVFVTMDPVRSHVSDFLQGIKDVAIQHLDTIGTIESFDIGVLRWFAWLDVIEGIPLVLVHSASASPTSTLRQRRCLRKSSMAITAAMDTGACAHRFIAGSCVSPRRLCSG